MKKRIAIIVTSCMLALSLTGIVYAEEEAAEETVEIIGAEESTLELGEAVELSDLTVQTQSMEAYAAEDEHYVELYVSLLLKNTGTEDCDVSEEMTASLDYMSRYQFEMDIDHFVFPTETKKTVTDYVLDPLCEMTVVLHTQIPNAVVEREGELTMTISCGGDSEDFSLSVSDIGTVQDTKYAAKIPSTAQVWNGHSYEIYTPRDMGIETYDEAEAYCESLGGHLATITSAAENQVIQYFRNSVWNKGDVFFGFTDQAIEGVFVWENGEDSTYTNWDEGEPNDKSEQDYVQMYSDGTWDDDDFGDNFVCEWDTVG